jgi:hypothetical protein
MLPATQPPPPLSPADLRAELQRAIRRRGITVVAAETGAAHQTLRAYLAGSRVNSITATKLVGWYARYAEDPELNGGGHTETQRARR